MIHPDCFQRPWLTQQAGDLRINPNGLELLERCMVALELVGRLSEGGLDFVFKGGTSLVLLLPPLRRLSIDVDIITPESLGRLQAVLATATRTAPFVGVATHEADRDRDSPPVKYFKVPFRSAINPLGTSHVQLDVVTSVHVYPAITRQRIEAPFIRLESEAQVGLPTIGGLLGDKLSAFAPTTIGVLYDPPPNRRGEPGEPRPLRILKQLFDVHHLFAAATDLTEVEATYQATFNLQNIARGGTFTLDQCLADTINAARELCLMPSARDAAHTDRQTLLRRGHTGLTTHLVGEGFGLDLHVRVAAARAALLATLIRHGLTTDVPRDIVRSMPPPADIGLITLTGENAAMQPMLRRTAPEALYLWSLVEDAAAQARDATP